MSLQLNVLIVDDHPLIIESYKRVLEHLSQSSNNQFITYSANSCNSAVNKIRELQPSINLDLVFLDIRLPPDEENKINSGEDLGIMLKKMFFNIKIIISTSFTDNYRLTNILKNVNPEGLLLKNDLTFESLKEAIKSVLNDTPYYSKLVLKLIRKHISRDIELDQIDRQMLYQLSLGTKTKDLPKFVHLSLAAIERRKRKLNELFQIEGRSKKTLIKCAREKGFI